MRLVNKIFIDDINISVFDLDLKYVLKFEFRGLEQTYKVDKLEFVNISELESKLRYSFSTFPRLENIWNYI